MKEAYVSYEVAKLLKEKGFDEPCFAYYEDDGNFRQSWSNYAIQNKTNPCFFGNAAPTHQMACTWLREKNIGITPEIHITQDPKDYYWSAIIYYLDKSWDIIEYVSAPSKSISEGYDDVIERAIKYALESLI